MKKVFMGYGMAMVMALSGCSASGMNGIYTNNSKIASAGNSYNLNKKEQTIEEKQYTGQFELEGMCTLWRLDAEEDMEVEVSYLFSVTQGEAKLVLITPDGQVQDIVVNEDKMVQEDVEVIQLALQKGENRIKVVARDKAKIALDMSVSEGQLEEIGFK
jgi:hypothetical protein